MYLKDETYEDKAERLEKDNKHLRGSLEYAGGMMSIGENGKAFDAICLGLGVDWDYFNDDDDE